MSRKGIEKSTRAIDLGPARPGQWLAREVRFGDVRYPFHVHSGERSWAELAARLTRLEADRLVVVTDDGVPGAITSEVGGRLSAVADTVVLSIPNSEKAKTIDTLDGLAERALRHGVTRNSVIVALGGGLAGNVAGLLAALTFRGLRLVHLPTTLLGMSDSVLSLKQAVNSRVGKNHLGTFHAPVLVWNHLDFLATLPREETQAALCEMIKNVLGICPERYDEVAATLRPDARYAPRELAAFIDLCVDAKTAVMRDDPREKREALVLEYGHTVGHAAELLTGGALRHGHAIGVGMLVAARAAVLLGLMDPAEEGAHRTLLERNGAPTRLPEGLTADEILAVVRRDNKRGYVPFREGTVDMVLLEGLGRPHWVGDNVITQVEEPVVRAAVEAYLAAGPQEHAGAFAGTAVR
ncbi:2-deoxy-scyllo-inosose synthase [Actinomadura rubrisoli]|uniref:3-dehydroquinate synthase n=1 Tax=Actinomadura rubrisoli TaxID=2530368 RepID=A0A4R4ZS81_9ACTN|nr:2-deoxy-scyllo-inosose synthase [Actinomadura rubrisoli]TDD60799.1 3-dehydroquinate synthase [Actinomadura rubrisoli]